MSRTTHGGCRLTMLMAGLCAITLGTACAAPGGIVGGPCARVGKAEATIIVATTRATVITKRIRFTARFASFHAPFTTKVHVRRRRRRAEYSNSSFSRLSFLVADSGRSFFPYSPECVEWLFCELRLEGVLGSLWSQRSGDPRRRSPPSYPAFATVTPRRASP